jgi:hypothetical protein
VRRLASAYGELLAFFWKSFTSGSGPLIVLGGLQPKLCIPWFLPATLTTLNHKKYFRKEVKNNKCFD